jgi:hypothetical protein
MQGQRQLQAVAIRMAFGLHQHERIALGVQRTLQHVVAGTGDGVG